MQIKIPICLEMKNPDEVGIRPRSRLSHPNRWATGSIRGRRTRRLRRHWSRRSPRRCCRSPWCRCDPR